MFTSVHRADCCRAGRHLAYLLDKLHSDCGHQLSQTGNGKQQLTVCPIHNEPMKVRKGDFGIFTSHYLGTDASGKKLYCKGVAK